MTDNISRITDKIISDANDKAAEIIAEAHLQANEILSKAKADAQERNEEINCQAQADSQSLRTRIESDFNMKKRSRVLLAKQELICEAYDKAMDYLLNINDTAYLRMMSDFVIKNVSLMSKGDLIELILCSKDSDKGDKLISICKKALPEHNVVISPDTVNKKGGLIIRSKAVTLNYTFEAIIEIVKSNCDIEVSKILFSGEV